MIQMIIVRLMEPAIKFCGIKITKSRREKENPVEFRCMPAERNAKDLWTTSHHSAAKAANSSPKIQANLINNVWTFFNHTFLN